MTKLKALIFKTLFCLVLLLGSQYTIAQNNNQELVFHTVEKGENLYRISLKYGVTIENIMEWNELETPDYIKAGQILKIYLPKAAPQDEQVESAPKKDEQKEEAKPTPPQQQEKGEENKVEKEEKTGRPFNVAFLPTDSLKQLKKEKDIVYTGTRIAPKEEEYDSTGLLDISGYISAYYAFYTDSVGSDELQKFPTLSPHSNEVGVNLIQVSTKYNSEKVRGIVTLQWGDMPDAAWSPRYNLIQQANLGVRLMPKLWFDIGYFRTHIGLESVQPRENINSTIAVTTFVEPYYLSGAKLTWQISPKLTVQANGFSQFNGFIENNYNKALGFSAMIDPTPNLSITLNTITSDDTPQEQEVQHKRWYNDLYLSWKTKRTVLGFEFNFGKQTHSKLDDSTGTANMAATLLALKYLVNKKLSFYGRGEYCKDPDGFMAGTYVNGAAKRVGIDIWGATGGIELKPIPNSYVRFEYRYLKQNNASGDIFYWDGQNRLYRKEFVFSTGFWF